MDTATSSSTFEQLYPSYARTRALDQLRESDYVRVDRTRSTYLDYTAASLYGQSQIDRHLALLRDHVFGNPHSTNPASTLATRCIADVRSRILQFFHASEAEWAVIFTANASQALKLVGEAYPFEPGSRFLLTFDNHNSVNGIREFARARGATATYIPIVLPELRVDERDLGHELEHPPASAARRLFAYPAQSNFSGVQHPLEWIDRAHAFGWDVLLDASAFAPTNPLDLSRWHPDFLSLSFYKMFGYPTGVGCLLARREALARLHRPWFSGGTIEVVSIRDDTYRLMPGEAAFEDGTLDFLMLPAVAIGLDQIDSVGIHTIHERVRCLTGWLLDELLAMRQSNGRPLVRLYGPSTTDRRGGIVTFNLYDADGQPIDHRRVEERAAAANISLRTGSFCNPGGGEVALGLTGTELASCFKTAEPAGPNPGDMTVDDFRLCVDARSTGAVRVSLGLVSNLADVNTFLSFAKAFIGA